MNLYEQIQHELDSKSWNYYNMKVGDVLKNTKRSRRSAWDFAVIHIEVRKKDHAEIKKGNGKI